MPMAHRLQFCLSTFILEGFRIHRVQFIENAASDAWDTSHCVDRPNCACKGRSPGNAKHSCQK
jgi:hypothetical protein